MVEYEGGDFRNYLVRNSNIIPQFDAISIGQYKFSIQASEFTYCSPRENLDPYAYTEFELGYRGQLYNQHHDNIIDSHNIDDSIVAYVDYIKIQQMLDWYYNMMTKEQYLKYVVELERAGEIKANVTPRKTYEYVKKSILEFPSSYTLNDICIRFIRYYNESKYRKDLHDYLHLTYADLLDETTSSNVSYQSILDAL